MADNNSFYTDSDYIAGGLLNSDFVYDPGGKSLQGGAYTLRSWRGDFYIWQEGRYIRTSNDEMQRIITQHIQTLNESAIVDREQQIAITSQRINNVMLCLKGRIGIVEQTELGSWPDGREKLITTIAVKNGLLMLDRKGGQPVLTKHTPDYFTFTKLPYGYDPEAKCERWEDFLNDVMLGREEYMLLLKQWAGYLFRPDLREQKFILCCGEGANGKGVFFEVIGALVGAENCSEVPLTRFSQRFALYGTLGKVVNMTNESSHIIADEAETMLKSYVAGDRFTFERKFREPLNNVVPTAKIMIATNALPRFNDKTHGIWRRILLVPFDKVIPPEAQIKDLAEQIKRELPGILNWAIEGLQSLNSAGGFTIPENSNQLIEDYRREADPARAFLCENYRQSTNDESTCSGLYDEYKQYCLDNGFKPMSNTTFGQQVKRVFPKVERVRIGGRDNREWVYQGLVSQGAEEQCAFLE